MDLRYTQPNHQHKCWFCTFLQTMNMLKLYSFLGSVFNFMLHVTCTYALVTFRHKSHLVRVGKGRILDYNTCFGCHKPTLNVGILALISAQHSAGTTYPSMH